MSKVKQCFKWYNLCYTVRTLQHRIMCQTTKGIVSKEQFNTLELVTLFPKRWGRIFISKGSSKTSKQTVKS